MEAFNDKLENPKGPLVETDKKDFAENISERLNSESFREYMVQFPIKKRNDVIGLALEYNILHPDGFDFDEFMETLLREVKEVNNFEGRGAKEEITSQIFIDSVAKKMNISKPFSEDGEKAIFDYLVDKMYTNGYVYHAFNGCFESSIRANGLDHTVVPWDIYELEEITEIGKRHGIPMLLGWHDLNSKGKVFFDEHPYNLYRYSVTSPEWFAQFTAEGFHIDANGNRKSAFYRRDYEAAKSNVVDACRKMKSSKAEDVESGRAYPNITAEEEEKILTFFDKYWKTFCGPNSNPKVAIIKKFALEELRDDYTFARQKEKQLQFHNRYNKDKPFNHSFQKLVSTFLYNINFGNDLKTDKVISPDLLHIIDLPEYRHVHPEENIDTAA